MQNHLSSSHELNRDSYSTNITHLFTNLLQNIQDTFDKQRRRRTSHLHSNTCSLLGFQPPRLWNWLMSKSNATNSNYNSQPDRYAVLTCGQPPEGYVEQFVGDLGDMTIKFITKNSDSDISSNACDVQMSATGVSDAKNWKKYLCYKNDIPTLSEILQYKGIVITGSKEDAHATDIEWINELRELISQIYSNNNNNVLDRNYNGRSFNVIGICFGHQLIATALKNGASGRAAVGWEIGLKTIHFNDRFKHVFKGFDVETLKVLMLHRDCVLKLPENGVLLASSDNTEVEMYTLENEIKGSDAMGLNINTFCMQGHPEFCVQFVKFIIDLHKETMPPKTAADALRSMENNAADTLMWQKMFQYWLQKE